MRTNVKYSFGSITDAPELIIAHGCNAQGKMNKGVAKAIREKWPAAFLAYESEVIHHGVKLGDVIWARTEVDSTLFDQRPEAPWVANVITQERYGNDGTRYVSYDAIDVGLRRVAQRALAEIGTNAIAVPAIGTGLGGGNWGVIYEIIRRIQGVDWTVYCSSQEQIAGLERQIIY